jgi:4-hydroxy-3-methylbut-2-enyl diphosphate reductase
MAIDIVDEILDAMDDGEKLYVYHEIVHNRHVVDRLRKKGAIFVENISEIPKTSVVVFSAHGVSPEIKKEAASRSLICIDATCPLVTKVHAEAIRYAKRGWQIILIGHRNHQEVVGTQGEAPDAIQILESPEGIENLHIIDPKALVYLTQTTLSIEDADVIINALKEAYPAIHSPPSDDICYATTNRQIAVRDDAPTADLVLVVGSQNSSNSLRLTEIAKAARTPSFLIDDVSMLQPDWFNGAQEILITAGASAPERLVTEIIKHLVEQFDGELIQDSPVNEGMAFSMPSSLNQFLQNKNVTVEGNSQ